VHTRAALEQAAVEIKHVAGERFASRRTAQQQRDLTGGHRLLRQIVVNDQGVLAVIHEVLAHGHARVGGDVLQGGRGGGRGGDDNGVRERAVLFQLAHAVGGGRRL